MLVFGDLMLDRYTWGDAERVSPEAPVLVLQAENDEVRLGGAASVAALLAGLGARPLVAGVVGDDPEGRIIQRLLGEQAGAGHGEVTGESGAAFTPTRSASKAVALSPFSSQLAPSPLLLTDPSRSTTHKQRFLGRAAHHHAHQILRVDRESREPLEPRLAAKLAVASIAALPACRAVLISDYGKGVCAPRLLADVIAAARARRLPVLVDPARGVDFSRYGGASLIKPNRDEASAAAGRPIGSPDEAFAAGRELCRRYGIAAAVITLDADGLVLVEAGGLNGAGGPGSSGAGWRGRHFAARTRAVCDVTGAGDTVLAVLGLAAARHDDLALACRQAVLAAGLQVERLGVAQVTWDEIQGSGIRENSDHGANVEDTLRGAPAASTLTRSASKAALTRGASKATLTRGASKATLTRGASKATPTRGASKATPTRSASKATPTRGASKATPTRSASKATPTRGASKATPTRSASKATPTRGASKATPTRGASKATPTRGASKATPTRGASKATPTRSASKATPTRGASKATPTRGASKATLTRRASKAALTRGASNATPTRGASKAAGGKTAPAADFPRPITKDQEPRTSPKITSLDALVPLVSRHIAGGRRVVFTNGCFDLLHLGHARLLAQAKAAGDVLIVAINGDAGVERLKGPGRPVMRQADRAELIAALGCVDHVVIFDDDTPERLILSLRPDVLVKGADYRRSDVMGRRFVESYGGRVLLADIVPDRSTTSIIERIVASRPAAQVPRRQPPVDDSGARTLSLQRRCPRRLESRG